MPTNLTNTDTWESTVVGTADGDTANAATFNSAPQDLTNRTTYLYNRSPEASQTEIPIPPALFGNINDRFDFSSFSGMSVRQSSVTDEGGAFFALPILTQDTVSLKVTIDPGTGRAGLPATLPQIELWKLGGSSAIATQTDTSGSLAAYETSHTITLSTAQSFDADQAYVLVVRGETDSNSQIGLLIERMSVTI